MGGKVGATFDNKVGATFDKLWVLASALSIMGRPWDKYEKMLSKSTYFT